MSGPDRSWLVAGLTLAGVTAQDIADKMSCSLRLVRTIRAEDMTQVCYLAQQQLATMADDLRQAELNQRLTARELTKSRAETERVQGRLDQITDKLAVGEPIRTCYRGHPLLDDDDVYRSGGRAYCRECNRENTINYRRKQKRAEQQRHSGVCRTESCEPDAAPLNKASE